MSNVKRTSIRCNLNNERDQKVWSLLHNLEVTGYSSLQDFIHDALLHYHRWIADGRTPYLQSGIEAEFKRWMKEVLLAEGIGVVKTGEAEQKNEKETAEIEEDAMTQAYDFLSTL